MTLRPSSVMMKTCDKTNRSFHAKPICTATQFYRQSGLMCDPLSSCLTPEASPCCYSIKRKYSIRTMYASANRSHTSSSVLLCLVRIGQVTGCRTPTSLFGSRAKPLRFTHKLTAVFGYLGVKAVKGSSRDKIRG